MNRETLTISDVKKQLFSAQITGISIDRSRGGVMSERGLVAEVREDRNSGNIVKLLKSYPSDAQEKSFITHLLALNHLKTAGPLGINLLHFLSLPQPIRSGNFEGRPCMIETKVKALSDSEVDSLKRMSIGDKYAYSAHVFDLLVFLENHGVLLTDFKLNDLSKNDKPKIPLLRLPSLGTCDLGGSWLDSNSVNCYPNRQKAWEASVRSMINFVGYGLYPNEHIAYLVPTSAQVHNFSEMAAELLPKLQDPSKHKPKLY